jgi:RNA polymerase sigma factor (sigma-70 family)
MTDAPGKSPARDDLDIFVQQIVARDKLAFAQWIGHAEGQLRASLARYARVVDTEAVVQEALLRLWQAAPEFVFDDRPNGFLRLAIRIARNLAIDSLRKRRETLLEPDQEEPGETWEPPDPMLRKTIRLCFDQLPHTNQRIFAARLESHGAESDEVLAGKQGMRLNTFLQNFTRARRLIAACLEKHGVRTLQELTT